MRLFLSLIAISFQLFSCKEQIVENYTSTQIYNLTIIIYDSTSWSYVADGELSGKLQLINSAELLEFDVVNGDNQIDIPFGFYQAYLNGFENCSILDYNLAATGGNKEVFKKAYLGVIPHFKVTIVGHEIIENNTIQLMVKPNTNSGRHFWYYIWGTNSLDNLSVNAQKLRSGAYEVYNDGIFSVYVDNNYRYYNVTVVARSGNTPEVEFNDWYEPISE